MECENPTETRQNLAIAGEQDRGRVGLSWPMTNDDDFAV